MSESEELNDKLSKAKRTANKNIKLLMEMVKTLDDKIEANKTAPTAEDKENMAQIFQDNGIGKPKGTYEDKQKQCLRFFRGGKIKEPKPSTLEFYKIVKDFDGNYELMVNALK